MDDRIKCLGEMLKSYPQREWRAIFAEFSGEPLVTTLKDVLEVDSAGSVLIKDLIKHCKSNGVDLPYNPTRKAGQFVEYLNEMFDVDLTLTKSKNGNTIKGLVEKHPALTPSFSMGADVVSVIREAKEYWRDRAKEDGVSAKEAYFIEVGGGNAYAAYVETEQKNRAELIKNFNTTLSKLENITFNKINSEDIIADKKDFLCNAAIRRGIIELDPIYQPLKDTALYDYNTIGAYRPDVNVINSLEHTSIDEYLVSEYMEISINELREFISTFDTTEALKTLKSNRLKPLYRLSPLAVFVTCCIFMNREAIKAGENQKQLFLNEFNNSNLLLESSKK